jgi:hypothetical protein
VSAELVKHQAVPAASLPEKMQYAKALAASGMLPGQYRQQPANLLYALEYAESLGLHPMAAITGIHVIEGKPSASAALISALVRRAGHKLRVKGDDAKAVAQIIRADDPDFTYEVVWTLARAEQAGLARKDVWKKYPAAMLKARAITEVARDACEEALSGMHYTPEELGANVDQDGEPVAAEVQQLRRVQPGEGDPWTASGPQQGNVTPPEQEFADNAAKATDPADVREAYRQAKEAGFLAATVKVGDDSQELGAYLIARGQQLAEPAPTGGQEKTGEDDVTDAVTVEAGADEHAQAVAELRQFAADNGIADIDAAAYPHLGAPLDDVSASAIRNLTAQLRATAA